MADQSSGLLTVAETAKLLMRSTEQVRRYLREGVLPGQRLGGQWFVRQADVEAFHPRRRDASDFPRGLAATASDPLGDVIAIGGSGGADIATGKLTYLRTLAGEGRS